MMERYVPQGVFDRRVKLIEEKLKRFGLDSDLLNKLEADNKYYVDQIVDNINSGIISFDSINQQIEDALAAAEDYTDAAISHVSDAELTAVVNQFVSGYNNFAANTLRFNDVFDADGEFTGKIRPTSIETAALFVGTRSQQLALNGIEFRVLPYEETNYNKGKLQIIKSGNSSSGTITQNSVAGYMFHYGFGTDTTPKVYVIKEDEINIASYQNNANKGLYIYAQLTYNNVTRKKVEDIDSNIFNEKYLFLYTKSGNDYPRVASTFYRANPGITYYIKNDAYVADNTKSLAEYLEYTISSESAFIESVGKIYTKSGNVYTLVPKASYDSNTDYYESTDEDDVKNPATTESAAESGASGTSSEDYIASIIISQDQITLKQVQNKLTIKLGYISIATNTSRPIENTNPTQYYKQRKVDMTYGSTTIDGRLITTGKIEGNGAWFDLDNGVIGGKIEFTLDGTQYTGTLEDIFTGSNTEIAGGMISSNIVKLKPVTYVIPDFDSDNYHSGNVDKIMYSIYGGGSYHDIEIHEIKDYKYENNQEVNISKGLYPGIITYDSSNDRYNSTIQLYKHAANSSSYTAIYPIVAPNLISGGVAGIKEYPAFWAGGTEYQAKNIVTIRQNNPDFGARYTAYQAIKNKLPNVFIDFDGFARLGSTWIKGDAVSYDGLTFTDVGGTLEIAKGGTGATTAANARANLGTLGAKIANGYNGMTTMSGADNDWIRTTSNGIIPYQSGGASAGHCYLGTDSWYFRYGYIQDIYGYLHGNISGSSTSCSGNAATATSATKATQDGDGYTISSTYLKKSGGTMTGNLTLLGGQYNREGALNCNNSDIINVNSILTADNADSFGEGLCFYRSASTWDCMSASSGNFYFGSNKAYGAAFVGDAAINCGSVWLGKDVTTDGTKGIFWHNSSSYGIYRTSGGWTSNNYQQLKLDWPTGIILDGGSQYGKSGVQVTGNFWATGAVTALASSSSDKRLKKNIKSFNAKQIIDKLKPVEFEWNKKANKYNNNLELNKKNYGLIAQDSDNIIDDFVFDLPNGKGYKGVKYEKLIPILLQAVKEQQKEIDELKRKLNEL